MLGLLGTLGAVERENGIGQIERGKKRKTLNVIEMEMREEDTQIEGFIAFFPDEFISEIFNTRPCVDDYREFIVRVDNGTYCVSSVFDLIFVSDGHCPPHAPKLEFHPSFFHLTVHSGNMPVIGLFREQTLH